MGGSLGARSINEALSCAFISMHLQKMSLQLIWQTGKSNCGPIILKNRVKKEENIWVNDFIKEMEMGYAAADIVISRAGAMSVTELCVAGKPTVFVPFPHAAEDHQTSNAMAVWLINRLL